MFQPVHCAELADGAGRLRIERGEPRLLLQQQRMAFTDASKRIRPGLGEPRLLLQLMHILELADAAGGFWTECEERRILL